MDLLNQTSHLFWNTYFWLPPGKTWKDLEEHVNWNDLWTYPIVMALIAVAIRYYILNNFIFYYIATVWGGLKDTKPRPPIANETLENLHLRYKTKQPPSQELIASAKKLDWSERKVERWLRQRKAQSKVTKYAKFLECLWQLCYYISIFSYGIYVMIDKPWLYDINKCWYDHPHHPVPNDIWWYYMLSLSFYWSMIFTHFFEARRKDFYQMLFHHFVTIFLIIFSWTCNFVRVGTLILILHDFADIPLHGAKLCIYIKAKALCDAIFALFAISWILSRVCIYPWWIVRNTLIDATYIIPMFPAYYLFNGLLITLLILHLYWTYYILKMIVLSIMRGEVADERSSNEDFEEEDNRKSS